MSLTTEAPLTPTTLAIQQLADIIAANAAWMDSISTFDPLLSKEFIRKSYYRPDSQQVQRPFAVIFEQAGEEWVGLTPETTLPFGVLTLHLGRPEETADPEFEERSFNNWCGQIAQDISKRHEAGYLFKTTVTDPPTRTGPGKSPAQKPFWEIGYSVNWGPWLR